MLSQTLQISFAKQQQLVSDDNNIVVNLFAIYVVSAEFSEGTLKSLNQSSTSHSQFEIKLRTTVPVAIALDISSAIILSPTETNLINNNGYDFFESIVIVENSKNYFDGDCLIATQTRCWQEFSIIIETNDCPTDSGLKFNGDYIFSSDFTCRDVENENTNSACTSYVNNSNPLPITMDSVDFSYTEACDAIIYQLDLSGDIDFYDMMIVHFQMIKQSFLLVIQCTHKYQCTVICLSMKFLHLQFDNVFFVHQIAVIV